MIGLTAALVVALVTASPSASGTVTPAAPLTLDPAVAPGNVVVAVSGQTTPGPRPCVLFLDKLETGSCSVSDSGVVSGRLTVPAGSLPSPDHTVIACVGSCKTAALAFISRRQLLSAPLTVPNYVVKPLTGKIQAPGHAKVTGSGFSPGGKCQLTAGQVTARCDVDALGRLSGSLPVTNVTPTGSYRVDVTNVGPGFAQDGRATLTVIGTTAPTTTSSAPSPSRSPTPSPTTSSGGGGGDLNWTAVAAWGGGIGGGGLLLGGAAFSALRWRRRPRTVPSVQVTLRARPMLTPRLVGVHSSHLHAVHLRLRAGGTTSFSSQRREERR